MVRLERIRGLFNELFLNDFPRAESSNDRLLVGKEFYETKTWVCNRISRLWRQIFQLYGWEICSSYHKYNLIQKDKRAVVFMQNSYSSANNSAKESIKYHLTKFKRQNPDWLVIHGAVNFKENLEYQSDGILYLIGDPFLNFMLGEDKEEIESLLVSLFKELSYL